MTTDSNGAASAPAGVPTTTLVHDDVRRIVPGDADRGEVQVLHEHLVWENDVVQLFNDHVRYPAREHGEHVEADSFRLANTPDKSDGVITVPVTHDDRILLVRQFRHPVRLWMLELPRGGRKMEETPEEATARELHEETGYAVDAFYRLGRVAPDSGQLTTMPYLVAARVHRGGAPDREDTEAIDRTVTMRYSELRAACERGEIMDGYTIAAVLRLAPYVEGDRIRLDAVASASG